MRYPILFYYNKHTSSNVLTVESTNPTTNPTTNLKILKYSHSNIWRKDQLPCVVPSNPPAGNPLTRVTPYPLFSLYLSNTSAKFAANRVPYSSKVIPLLSFSAGPTAQFFSTLTCYVRRCSFIQLQTFWYLLNGGKTFAISSAASPRARSVTLDLSKRFFLPLTLL